jgi:hypothetical protein
MTSIRAEYCYCACWNTSLRGFPSFSATGSGKARVVGSGRPTSFALHVFLRFCNDKILLSYLLCSRKRHLRVDRDVPFTHRPIFGSRVHHVVLARRHIRYPGDAPSRAHKQPRYRPSVRCSGTVIRRLFRDIPHEQRGVRVDYCDLRFLWRDANTLCVCVDGSRALQYHINT